MEHEGRTMSMLMQSMKPHTFGLTFATAIVLWACTLLISSLGPHLYQSQSFSAFDCPVDVHEYDPEECAGIPINEPGYAWIGKFGTIDRLNQRLFLVARIQNKQYQDYSFEKEIAFDVYVKGKKNADNNPSNENPWTEIVGPEKNAHINRHKRVVSCEQGKTYCDPLTMVHVQNIDHNEYWFNISLLDVHDSFVGDVKFTFLTGNANFTLMSLWWRFFFLFGTVIFTFIFLFRVRHFKWGMLAREQKWTVLLLFAVMGLNNPLYPLVVLTSSWIPLFIDTVMVVSFTIFIFLFWLVMFDAIRKESQKIGVCSFYFFKISILAMLWIGLVSMMFMEQLRQLDHPAQSFYHKDGGTVFLEIVIASIIVIYVLWLAFVVIRTLTESRGVEYLGKRVFIFASFTGFVIFVSIAGLLFDVLGPVLNTSAQILPFWSLYNIYVWILAVLYLPKSSDPSDAPAAKHSDISMSRLEDDPMEEEERAEEPHIRVQLPPEHRDSSSSDDEKNGGSDGSDDDQADTKKKTKTTGSSEDSS